MRLFNVLVQSVRGSLRAKVTMGALLPLVLILLISTVLQYQQHQQMALDNLSTLASQSGRVIESSLRNAMLTSNFAEVQAILDTIGESNDFSRIYLMDTKGKVIFAPHRQRVGTRLNNNQLDCKPCHSLNPNERPNSVIVTAEGQRVFRSMYPIENAPECSVCHDPDQRLIGVLLTDIPIAPLEKSLASGFLGNLLWWGGTIFITILIINLAMNRIIIKPLTRLLQALSNFSQEKLDLRLPIGDPDEIGQLTKAYNAMGQRIEAEVAQNRQLSDNLRRQSVVRRELLKRLITAQEIERKRVSREIHDDFGQALGALSLQVQLLERLIATDINNAIVQLKQTQSLINETTEHMYDLILALRPSALDELGLVAALRTHAERYLNGSGMNFKLESNGLSSQRLPPDIETALYRIFQEALNNIRRHSGAKNVNISLALKVDELIGEVYDDGVGFDPQSIDFSENNPRGLGLLGIQERVDQYCGQVEIISKPGGGTRIRVHIPVYEVEND